MPGRFLCGDVKNRTARRQPVGGLEQQGRFADAGIPADQDEGAGNDAASQHPVKFADTAEQA